MMTDRVPFAPCVAAACLCLALGCSSAPEPSPQPVESAAVPAPVDPLLAADTALTHALAGADSAAVLALVDEDVTWTDASGRTIGKPEMAQALPTPAIGDESSAGVRRFNYARVGVVQIDKDRQHSLRVWVQRPEGWRLFVYHEVQSLASPPTTTPGTGKECINPCRSVPYTPTNDNERAVIAAFMALETASHAADVANWGTHVADEFVLVSSNSDRTFSKAERIDGLRKSTFGGVSPTELVSARLYDFGDTVVMRSQQRPVRGAPLQITRVWVNRGGTWASTLSYQTSIQAAPPR
jgi:ketosteroid isomerase-like protein